MGSEPVHKEMTSFAMYADQTIKAKGIDPIAQADKYYEEVDIAMRNQFPNFFGVATESVEAPEEPTKRQPSTVVATASRESSNKKPSQVRLTQTQVRLARQLGISPEQYANQLLKEAT